MAIGKVKGMIISETDRLILRHFHIRDLDALAGVFGDAEVMRFGPGPQDTAWVQEWLRACLANYQAWGFGPYAVMEKHTRQTLGYCGLTYFPDLGRQPEVEIGYRLARAHWGRGYATEAAQTVRDYAFAVLGLPRLIAMIDPGNTASIRVAEKLGMHYENEIMLEGYTHPDHIYAMQRS